MTSSSSTKVLLSVIAAVVLVAFAVSVVYLSHVYACLTVAFVLAYFLEPVVAALERRKIARDIGAPLTLIVFLAGLVLMGMGIVPRIIGQGRELIQRLPAVYLGVTSALGPLSERYLGYNAFTDIDKLVASFSDPTTLVQPIGGALTGIVSGILSHTVQFVTTALGLLIIPLMAYYLLRDFPQFHGRVLYLVPKRHHRTVNEIVARLDGVLGGFIRGQLVVSSILATYYSVFFAALGVRMALVLGLMAGFFNVVPYLGILSVLTLTFLIAFINGAGTVVYLGLAIIFAVGMAAEGSVLTPRIVGRKVGLRPLTLILSLLVGGELLGLAGMLLAVPIAALARVFVTILVERYRSSEGFTKG